MIVTIYVTIVTGDDGAKRIGFVSDTATGPEMLARLHNEFPAGGSTAVVVQREIDLPLELGA